MAVMTTDEVSALETQIDATESVSTLKVARRQIVSFSLNQDTIHLAEKLNQKLTGLSIRRSVLEPLDVRHIRVLIALAASAKAVRNYQRLQHSKISSPFSLREPTFDWQTHFHHIVTLIAETKSTHQKCAYQDYFMTNTVKPLRQLVGDDNRLNLDELESRFSLKTTESSLMSA